MKLKFSIQDYQLQAVKAVVDVFDGQPLAKGLFEMPLLNDAVNTSLVFSEKGVANQCLLQESTLLENIQKVQATNGIEVSSTLEKTTYSKNVKTFGHF